MGMLFNSAGTTKVLQLLNDYFGLNKLPALNANDFNNWPLHGGTYTYAKGKGLWFQSDATLDGKWKKWLDHLDKHPNRKKGNEPTAQTIGDAIASAINNNLSQIEFFAVPDDAAGSYHISAEAGTMVDPGGAVSQWITVYTLTYDKLRDPARPSRRRRERDRER